MTTIKPFDIVSRTPGTNCGECGHPACLAFAASVIRGGEDPEKCPYIDLTGLDLGPPAEQEEISALPEKRDWALVKTLQDKIQSVDFTTVAKGLGTVLEPPRPDTLIFSYLGQKVELGKTDILINGKQPADPRDQILLYNYIASQGGTPPDGSWVGMESLPNSISKIRTLAVYCEAIVARTFAGRPPALLARLAGKLGGIPGPPEYPATVSMIIPVLPMVPHYLLFWDEEPTEGFEAKVKILFDRHVLDFLDLESLVFTAERLAEMLVNLAKDQKS